MSLFRQYNKFFMSILAVLLPAFMLHLNFTNSDDIKGGYDNTDEEAYDSFANIYKPFYYLNYFSSMAALPEEEAAAVHFIRAAARYMQYPQRFLYTALHAMAFPFFSLNPVFLFLLLFMKEANPIHEIAAHIGGHAPPALVSI